MSKQNRKHKPIKFDDFDDEFENDFDGDWVREPIGRKPKKPVRGQSEKYKSAYYN